MALDDLLEWARDLNPFEDPWWLLFAPETPPRKRRRRRPRGIWRRVLLAVVLLAGLTGMGTIASSVGLIFGTPTAAGSNCPSAGNPVLTTLSSGQLYAPNAYWQAAPSNQGGSSATNSMEVCGSSTPSAWTGSSWTDTENATAEEGNPVQSYNYSLYTVGSTNWPGPPYYPHNPVINTYSTISSTFSEGLALDSSGQSYDAAYDLWTNDYAGSLGLTLPGGHETMMWNDWGGTQTYAHGSASNGSNGAAPNTAVTLGGVNYHFHLFGFRATVSSVSNLSSSSTVTLPGPLVPPPAVGASVYDDTTPSAVPVGTYISAVSGTGPYVLTLSNSSTTSIASSDNFYYSTEYVFTQDTPSQSGSVNILALFQWEVSNGYADGATEQPDQLEYGDEVVATTGNLVLPLTGLTFSLS